MEDTISRKMVIDAVKSISDSICEQQAIDALCELPSAQPETHEERTETHSCDCISRKAAIDAHYEYCNKHPDAGFPVWSLKILEDLPSAQPKNENEPIKQAQIVPNEDLISRKMAIDTLDEIYAHAETEAEARFHAQQRWIPCSERLPEEYGEYRITWTTSCSKKRFIGDAEYEITGEWDAEQDRFKGEWLLEDYIKHYPDVNVLAWKPLEEPYREERRTDEAD